MIQATGAILAGGKSTRMGTDKTLLRIDQQTLLERSVEKMQSIFAEVIIVGYDPAKHRIPGVRTLPDDAIGCGPLGGIQTALRHAVFDTVLIAACDLPFWDAKLASYLIESCDQHDGAVPIVNGYFEPLLAAYRRTCLTAIQDRLDCGVFKFTGFFQDVRIRGITATELEKVCDPQWAFRNLNTMADFEKVRR